jgi:hypothetical protein
VSSAYRLAVTGRAKTSPAEIFRIVTDPEMHVEIDGSGMLEAAPDSKRLAAAGDTFEMAMDRESLGDIPMGKYKVLNTVTRIVPNSLLEWNVGSAEHGPFGHVYGWEISAVNGDETEFTNYCDWTEISEEIRDRFPIVPREMMEQSVANLTALATQRSGDSS